EGGAALLDVADILRGARQDDILFIFAEAEEDGIGARPVLEDRVAADDRQAAGAGIVEQLAAVDDGMILDAGGAAHLARKDARPGADISGRIDRRARGDPAAAVRMAMPACYRRWSVR